MKKIFIICIAFLSAFVSSCYKENGTVERLQGKWKLTSFTGKPADLVGVIMPDSLEQTFTFKECKNAYTANCRCFYEIQLNDSTHIEADLTYTIKGEEIAIIGIYSNTPKWIQKREGKQDSVRALNQSASSTVPLFAAVPNYTKLYGGKRFFLRELNDNQNWMLERFKDSLQIRANYIGN